MRAWAGIRCVVFDFDGTLVDSNAIKRNAYFEVLAATPESRDVVEAVLRELPGADRYGVLAAVHARLAAAGAGPLRDLDSLVDAYSRLCETRVASCRALPGAVEALEDLRGRRLLYLDSATPTDALTRLVDRRGWRRFFRGVLGGPASKVDNLRSIARREQLDPDQMLYVGDGRVDLEAAEAFGCAFFGHDRPAVELPAESPLAMLVSELVRRSQPAR